MFKKNWWIVLLILGAAFSRLVPHWPNFTAIGAAALFAGAMLGPRIIAFLVPLAAMVLSDLALGFHNTTGFVYLAVILTTWVGVGFLKELKVMRWLGGALATSGLFFLITNFGVWAVGGLYPTTVEGLAQSYVMALPFLSYQVGGDLTYTAILFGAAFAIKGLRQSDEVPQHQSERR